MSQRAASDYFCNPPYLVQALTAWYGLMHLGALAPGQLALVHSAAGGVGLHALAMAHALGARVIGTVGHGEKVPLLGAHGLARHQVVVRDAERFGAQLDAALAGIGAPGFDRVFDAIAGPFFLPALVRLAPEGRHVLYGAADFMPRGARPNWLRLAWQYVRRPRLDPMKLIDKNRSIMGFNLIWLFERADRLPASAAAALALSAAAPHIGRTLSVRRDAERAARPAERLYHRQGRCRALTATNLFACWAGARCDQSRHACADRPEPPVASLAPCCSSL